MTTQPVYVFTLKVIHHDFIRGKITTDLGAYPTRTLAEVARDYFREHLDPWTKPQITFDIEEIRAGDWLNLNNMV
jgi:hypothetical protein